MNIQFNLGDEQKPQCMYVIISRLTGLADVYTHHYRLVIVCRPIAQYEGTTNFVIFFLVSKPALHNL